MYKHICVANVFKLFIMQNTLFFFLICFFIQSRKYTFSFKNFIISFPKHQKQICLDKCNVETAYNENNVQQLTPESNDDPLEIPATTN